MGELLPGELLLCSSAGGTVGSDCRGNHWVGLHGNHHVGLLGQLLLIWAARGSARLGCQGNPQVKLLGVLLPCLAAGRTAVCWGNLGVRTPEDPLGQTARGAATVLGCQRVALLEELL